MHDSAINAQLQHAYWWLFLPENFFVLFFLFFVFFFLYEFITTRLRLTDWALASFSESFSLKYRKALYEQFLSVNARIINYSYSVW